MAVHAGDLIRILATHCSYCCPCLRGAADDLLSLLDVPAAQVAGAAADADAGARPQGEQPVAEEEVTLELTTDAAAAPGLAQTQLI